MLQINKIETLLFKELTNLQKSKIVIFLVFLEILFLATLSLFLYLINPNFYQYDIINLSLGNIYTNIQNGVMPLIPEMLIVVGIEELLFRLPILLYITRKINFLKKVTLTLLLSFLFSLSHLVYFDLLELITVFPAVFVAGLVYSVVFIIYGGNKGKILVPFTAAFTIHFVWNFISFGIFGTP